MPKNILLTLRILNPIVLLSLSVWKPLAVMLMFQMYMTIFNIVILTALNYYMDFVLFLHYTLFN
jgi:hypothetical protein